MSTETGPMLGDRIKERLIKIYDYRLGEALLTKLSQAVNLERLAGIGIEELAELKAYSLKSHAEKYGPKIDAAKDYISAGFPTEEPSDDKTMISHEPRVPDKATKEFFDRFGNKIEEAKGFLAEGVDPPINGRTPSRHYALVTGLGSLVPDSQIELIRIAQKSRSEDWPKATD